MNKIILSFLLCVSFGLMSGSKSSFDRILLTLQSEIGQSSLSVEQRVQLNSLISQFQKMEDIDGLSMVTVELNSFAQSTCSDEKIKKYLSRFCDKAVEWLSRSERRSSDSSSSDSGASFVQKDVESLRKKTFVEEVYGYNDSLVADEIERLSLCGLTPDFLVELNNLYDFCLKNDPTCYWDCETLIIFREYLMLMIKDVARIVTSLQRAAAKKEAVADKEIFLTAVDDCGKAVAVYQDWLSKNPAPAPYKF
jgi:hypothetical protein